ncbi:hypothetical protein SO802_030268 [Lithocarpus litseifolius]|uniref:Uncharacterized protein n=1 Tax=Lithocarpus litseifolius TaxID=425828 RepID=A0AAW2BHQ3_9ROSI
MELLKNPQEGGSWFFFETTCSQHLTDLTLILCLTRLFLQLFPLQLPDTEKFVKIPLVGRVHIRLSNITIFHVTYPKKLQSIMLILLLHLLIVNTGEIGIVRE